MYLIIPRAYAAFKKGGRHRQLWSPIDRQAVQPTIVQLRFTWNSPCHADRLLSTRPYTCQYQQSRRTGPTSVSLVPDNCGCIDISYTGAWPPTALKPAPSLIKTLLMDIVVHCQQTCGKEIDTGCPKKGGYKLSQTGLLQIVTRSLMFLKIRLEMIRRVQKAKWFTVIADEVTDVSNKEQLSLVLRAYLHGQELASKIQIGQVQSASKVTAVTSVRNMMGVVDKVFKFFSAHTKRQMALERDSTRVICSQVEGPLPYMAETKDIVVAVKEIDDVIMTLLNRLKKPVTIHIQHCAGLKPGEEDKLSFVVAKEGATKFEFLPGGHFSSAHGSITLHSFSLFAIVSDMLYGSTYCGCIYYTNIEPDGSHEVHIVVIKKLSLALQIVSEAYGAQPHSTIQMDGMLHALCTRSTTTSTPPCQERHVIS
eukprot:Em0017g543a